jgi:alpha-L-fucosidase 2
MLLQSHDITENEQLLDGGPIRLLPAIRKDWSGSFRLRARGGFLLTCTFEKGTPTHVTILSERGRTVRLVNPFASCAISVNGEILPPKKDRLIELPTKSGESIQFSKAE